MDPGIEIQVYNITGIYGYRGTQGFRNIDLHIYRDKWIQLYNDKNLLKFYVISTFLKMIIR